MYVYIYIYTEREILTYIYTYLCIYIYIYIEREIGVYMRVINMYMYICIRVYIYIYTHIGNMIVVIISSIIIRQAHGGRGGQCQRAGRQPVDYLYDCLHYVYIYISYKHVCMCMYMYIYIYIYAQAVAGSRCVPDRFEEEDMCMHTMISYVCIYIYIYIYIVAYILRQGSFQTCLTIVVSTRKYTNAIICASSHGPQRPGSRCLLAS